MNDSQGNRQEGRGGPTGIVIKDHYYQRETGVLTSQILLKISTNIKVTGGGERITNRKSCEEIDKGV